MDSTESYTYRVRAYKKSGGSEYKSTAVELIGTASPAPVSSFKASEVTKKSVTLSWKKNANASGYQIQMYSGGTWATLATITKNSTTSYKIPSGLKSGTSYKFRICSFSGNGAKAAYSSYKTITVKTSK